MAVFKTHQFLPEIFQTDTNKKFLNATLDQLVSEPQLERVSGYIGRKLAPSYKSTDSYVSEVDSNRQNYQLEPSVILKNEITQDVDFAVTYPDTINKIKYYGGLVDNHNRLFESEYYSYDPKIDLDKFINFSQYFWLDTGPDSVLVSASNVPTRETYTVTYNTLYDSYEFTNFAGIRNPELTLARGGVYNFIVNEPSNKFWIQSAPGTSGLDPDRPNFSTREVFGVELNGLDQGTIEFKVPTKYAQNRFTSMTTVTSVAYATKLSYSQVLGANPDELIANHNGIDGPVSYLDGKQLVFVNSEYIDDAFWNNSARVVDGVAYFDQTNLVPAIDRIKVFLISIIPDEDGIDRIVLDIVPSYTVLENQKVKIVGGEEFAGKEFYNQGNVFRQVPNITATLDTLYYQSQIDSNAVGQIILIDPIDHTIDPANDIVGKPNYTSPTGVIFTNGMKVHFDTTVPAEWQNDHFYVEGVGSSIVLVPESQLISVEAMNASGVAEGGINYAVGDILTIQGGTYTEQAKVIVETVKKNNATATATIDSFTFEVTSILPVNGGAGYATAPTVTISPPTVRSGRTATATASLTAGVVTGITITDAGSGYLDAPTVTLSAPELGNISTFKIRRIGNYTEYPTNPVTVTGGTGSGARLQINLIPTIPDYITINRSSIDRNPWSRANRWTHMSVIQKTAEYTNQEVVYDQTKRANRPIIEFQPSLQLYNFGSEAKKYVNILDTTIEHAFVDVQGVVSVDTEFFTVGDLTLTTGDRVIFANDEDNSVRNKIFDFTIEKAIDEPGDVYKAYLIESADTDVVDGNTVLVLNGDNGGKQWHYNGTSWTSSQEKTAYNQEPLYDVIDSNGIRFSDSSTYVGTNFTGTKLFSYGRGTGGNDSVLGFPLSYKNFVQQGDIQFTNNFDQDTFSYLPAERSGLETIKVNSGYLQKNISASTVQRQNIWNIVNDFSRQYQTYNFVYDGVSNLFPIEHIPDTSFITPNVKVYVNNNIVSVGNFAISKLVDRPAILVNPELIKKGDSIFIEIFNASLVHKNAYYQVPVNLNTNTLNVNLQTLTLGQMRNHLITKRTNSLDVVGQVPGNSNLRDINYESSAGSILHQSSPAVYSCLFLNHPTMNFSNAIRLANKEYTKFKNKFLELATTLNIDPQNVAESVDTIIDSINRVKNDSFPWYHSDMIPHGTDEREKLPTYIIYDPDQLSYEITSIFNDKIPSNKAVLVYLTRKVNNVTTKTLLLKGRDYTFDQDRPAITFTSTFRLLFEDKIDIVEYNNTDGSFVPETPTKMGMYPKYFPEKYLDNTYVTAANVIQGHDGSLTPAFNDFRDDLLIELERRIYNNIKIEYNPSTFDINDYFPGKFRVTDYSLDEFNQVLGRNFLNWVGTNRVDYTANKFFSGSNPFTWNYRNFTDVVNGERLPGSWRAIYRYFYDTDRPHTHPWEMLGFSEKPLYWEERYGPAPYTGGNAILWSDLSVGYIHDGERAGFDTRYQRPNLADYIPVDDNGNLRSPEEILVSDFDSSDANTSFAVGEISPVELAWRRSSDYPFAVSSALALTKPGKYFALQANTNNYKRNEFTAQFEVSASAQHLSPRALLVNGYVDSNGTHQRTAGYINWIVDYVKNLGVTNSATVVKQNLEKINVQLSYKMASYTDKRFIELYAEQNSPSSIDDSILIPEENYKLEVYKGSPIANISYSAVIVTKSGRGYTVSGYDLNNPFFYIIPSQPSNNSYRITSGTAEAVVYRDFRKAKTVIPYGFEFTTKQQVVDFLVGYQRYLLAQGFIFVDRDESLQVQKDWILSAKEFLHWSQQGWKQGNIIVLTPVEKSLKVFDSTATVDKIENTPFGSRVLDVSFKPIVKNNFTVSRESNLFSLTTTGNQSIGFVELNLVQYEHLLVLDNITEFNDVIYAPELGNRQSRLKLVGAKTDNWNGSLELPGFMYSSDTIVPWQANSDYLKGSLVKNKDRYYTALENITASETFQTTKWKQVDKESLRYGMINNFATNAVQSVNYYDIENQPLDEEIQLFSNGLIGFRQRDFFKNLGISVRTQSKFYQGLIKQKGTTNAINALEGAEFNNLSSDIDWYENWAVRVGEYGALDTNDYVEFELNEQTFNANPSALQLVDNTADAEPSINAFTPETVYKSYGLSSTDFIRHESLDTPPKYRPLPVAGFVNINDVDTSIFNIRNFENLTDVVNNIGTGYKIWVARDFSNQWNVYRASLIDGHVLQISDTGTDAMEVAHSAVHNLSVDDIIVIKNFEDRFDGVYQVNEIVDSDRFLVTLYRNLDVLIREQSITSFRNSGLLFKLTSSRVNYPTDINSITPVEGWIKNDKVWVEINDRDKNWGVYNVSEPWAYNSKVTLDPSRLFGNDNFGYTISHDRTNKELLYVASPGSAEGRVSIFLRGSTNTWSVNDSVNGNGYLTDSFGKALANGSKFLAVGAPDSNSSQGYVYVYNQGRLQQIIVDSSGSAGHKFGESLAMSDDGVYLYIGAPGNDTVSLYARQSRDAESLSFSTRYQLTLDANVSVAIDDYIAYQSPGTTTSANARVVFDSTRDLTDTNVVIISGNVAAFSETELIAINGANVAANIVSDTYSTVDNTTFSNLSITSDDPTHVVVSSATGGGSYIPTVEYTYSGDQLTFVTALGEDQTVKVEKKEYYYIPIATVTGNASTNFGEAIATNLEGSVLAVGAKDQDYGTKTSDGEVRIYHRTVTKFTTDGISSTYTAPDALNDYYRVSLNDVELVDGTDYYTTSPSSVQFDPFIVPIIGQILKVETNQLVLDQTLRSNISGTLGQEFGTKLDLCGTGCNFYASSPNYILPTYAKGAVSRFVNLGRVYGNVVGTVSNATVTSGDTVIINDRVVEFVGTTLDAVVTQINETRIPGVTASNTFVTTSGTDGEYRLKITSDVKVAAERLNIKAGTGSALTDLGLEIYKFVQYMTHPNNNGETFGTALGLSQSSGKIAIGSDGADTSVDITFDATRTETKFDSGSTTISLFTKDCGAIYMHDLLPHPYEDENNPSMFAYSQKLEGLDLATGYNFGADVKITGDLMIVGVTNDSQIVAGGGSVYSYYNNGNKSGWELLRSKQPRADVSAITSAFIYDKKSSNIIDFLDVLDPAKGKLLGIANGDLDYVEDYDPASYNTVSTTGLISNTSFFWSDRFVGRTWWDVSTASFIDYDQGDLNYKLKNWGSLFPNSIVTVYEWVESEFLPSQYVDNGGEGIPKYADDSAYTSVNIVDPVTGIITQKFYYWVSGKNIIDTTDKVRNLSTTSIESCIRSPKSQNIPYVAPLAPNSLGLYNISQNLSSTDTVLHVETSDVEDSNLLHGEYQFVQAGNPVNAVPRRITDKLVDSLVGFDKNSIIIPDFTLRLADRIGILSKPQQSMFIDRMAALATFVKKTNSIIKNYPVLITKNPRSLYSEELLPTGINTQVASFTELSYIDTSSFADGDQVLIPIDSRYDGRWTVYKFNGVTREFELDNIQSYKTSLLWTPTDWYDSTYVDGHDINHVVANYGMIQTLSPAQDDYIKILDDGSSRWLIYRYEADRSLSLIAVQNGTVVLSADLYDPTAGAGFDSVVFDNIAFDSFAQEEVRSIFSSVLDEILIDSLAFEFNNLFIAMVNHVFEEQKNPDWIFKTSFIDVYHNLQRLEQIPNFNKPNQSFYEDYINEVKPYRTQLREFIPAYSKIDEATGTWTDFDLPARWFASESTFRSPNIQVSSDSTYFNQDLYKPYANSYKFKISDIIVGNAGVRYTLPPNVEISGGGGSGATASATVNFSTGTISSITVTKPGSGYTSAPTITINGTGEGATAHAVLNNEYDSAGGYNTVRSIDSTIKFDRINYTSNVTQWQANTAYPNTVVVDGNNAHTFDLNRVQYNSALVVSTQDIDVTDLYFKPDGTKMYIAGNNTDKVYEYTLGVPWEVTTASNVAVANVYTQDTSVQGLFFRDDGERMYAVGISSDSVYEYRLATPWSVNTAANISVKSIVSEEASARAVEFDKLGTRMYILGTLSDTVYEYELSIPWSVSSASYSSRSLYVGGEENIPTGMRFKGDGTELFITGQQTDKVWKYTLTTPWDVSTASADSGYLLRTTYPTGIAFKGDGTKFYVADPISDWVQQYNFTSDGIIPIESNVYITSGNIIFYNNTAYLATNANVSSQSIFDFTRYTEINSGNVLLNAADRITSYYVPSYGRPAKDLDQLMFGANYPGNKVQGKTFTANSFTLTSNVIGFSYTGHKITSANTQQVDFVERGFNLNDPIKIEGLYDNFNFENNATFRVVSISRDEMMLSGQPIESVVTLFLGANITANAGDYITQANSVGNARVLNNYTNWANIAVIHETQGFTEFDSNVVSVNGVATTANVIDVLSTGTANVKISNLYIDDLLDSNIVSFYTDTAIGTRPEDINIVGGFYLDGYNSHAPEELVPGRMFDALEMRVFTNTASNTASYGFRVFEPMSGDRRYYRINANSSTTLSANLEIGDVNLFVDDASVLPDPGAAVGIPGEVFINGELIHYYQKYDAAKILTASVWTANTEFATDSLITFDSNVYLVLGNVYANSTSYIDTTNIKQVYVNSLSQLRRGVDGTGSPDVHQGGARVVDSSLAQILPNIVPTTTTTLTGEKTVTANVTWRIGLSKPITVTTGDYMTMTSPAANVRILDTIANANVVAVHFVSGNLTIGSTANVLLNGFATQANVTTMKILGEVESDGNVSVTGKTIKQDYLWKAYGTGDTLESSTTEWATWIKDERSYTP